MYPVLFEIPGLGFPVRSFGLMVALGFIVALQVAVALYRRYGDDPENDPENFNQVALSILIGIIVGARALYVLVEVLRYLTADDGAGMVGEKFLDEPWTMLMVWEGGLVMYGGLAGGVLFGIRSGIKNNMRPISGLDVAMVAAFLGLAIGRIGCYLVGDDYGKVVPEAYAGWGLPAVLTVPDLEWLRANPESLFEHRLAGAKLWATQIWMSANAFVLFGIGLLLIRRRRYPGHTWQWLILLYAITRFTIEVFRGDAIRGVWFGLVSTSQLISIAGAAGALWLLWKNRGRREPMPGVAAPAAEGPDA